MTRRTERTRTRWLVGRLLAPLCAFATMSVAAHPASAQDPFVDAVAAFTPGTNGGFGTDLLPDIVLGPPRGSGELQGSFDVLALGIGGSIVLRFDLPVICDAPGADFTVFENTFHAGSAAGPLFTEYGYVAVSQDGTQFVTLPYDAMSHAGLAGQTPVFSHPDNGIDPLDPALSGGDSFDLADVGLAWAAYVRITDVGGAIPDTGDLPQFTLAPNAGFDLDAVAAVHACDPSQMNSPTPTVTAEPSETQTASDTPTTTPSATSIPTWSAAATASATRTSAPSGTPSITPSPTPTLSPIPSNTSTPPPTATASHSQTATPTASPTPSDLSDTPTATAVTASPSPTDTAHAPTHTPSASATSTGTPVIPTASATRTATVPIDTPTSEPTHTPIPSTATATPRDTPTAGLDSPTATAITPNTQTPTPADTATAPRTTITPTPAPIAGDLDGDGAVTGADVAWLIADLYAGEAGPASGAAADVNGDGRLSAADVARLASLVTAGVQTR